MIQQYQNGTRLVLILNNSAIHLEVRAFENTWFIRHIPLFHTNLLSGIILAE
jgi:hypothetical protein